MDKHGFFRVAAASPPVQVAHPAANARAILEFLRAANERECDFVVFPELCLTGYTCADLFGDETLLAGAIEALADVTHASKDCFSGLFVIGLPIRHGGLLYNVAAVIGDGELQALVPKQFLPNYKEFYEQRWFRPGEPNLDDFVHVDGVGAATFTSRVLFTASDGEGTPHALGPVVGVEICEDLWTPIPPSSHLALAGAMVIANLSASNEVTTKSEYRRALVASQSARLIAGYIYAGSGPLESTTDLVFGGHCLIAENGAILAESKRFERQGTLIVADLDIERLSSDRARMNSFFPTPLETGSVRTLFVSLPSKPAKAKLLRPISPHPFVPAQSERLSERCEEIFHIQVAGLAKRIEAANIKGLNIGVSGGLDSTLALLVATKTVDLLGLPRATIHGLTMPGFGTSSRTKTNADALMNHLGISAETIDIKTLAFDTFRALGHFPFGIDISSLALEAFVDALAELPDEKRSDLVFENVQARLRTMLLMSRGFVVGTGDMSELALGWATYNGDHMSMYNPNVSIPKTLVRFLVRWIADHEFDGDVRAVLHSIADTPISPELLPMDKTGKMQSTEESVGPYELHDFFLFHMLRFGSRPGKIYRLARQARFDRDYSPREIKAWLEVFYRRFFANQFKRSCLPDGPKVGSVSLSPRGDWRMPSDASAELWLAEVRQLAE